MTMTVKEFDNLDAMLDFIFGPQMDTFSEMLGVAGKLGLPQNAAITYATIVDKLTDVTSDMVTDGTLPLDGVQALLDKVQKMADEALKERFGQ